MQQEEGTWRPAHRASPSGGKSESTMEEKKTYNGEDVWRLECDIVDLLAILRALGVARNHIRRNALELL